MSVFDFYAKRISGITCNDLILTVRRGKAREGGRGVAGEGEGQ